MNYFDLHCDTVTECEKQGQNLERNRLAVDLARGSAFERWVQTFALWVPDTLRGEAAWACVQRQYAFVKTQGLTWYREKAASGSYAMLMVEGGAALAGALSHIAELASFGVRMLTLTWNGENEIASGAQATGGLKPFGRQVVRALEQAGILVDVSHLNEQSFWDVASCATRPIVATHSNAYALCRNPRNLKDDQITAIRASGGLIGLNFYPVFLSDPPPKAAIPHLCRHIEHFLALGCEDQLVIGSDFDGAKMAGDLSDLGAVFSLRQSMVDCFGETLTEKILFSNAQRFFAREGVYTS